MPAEIVTMTECADFYGVFEVEGSKGAKYRVAFGGGEGPATCTCPAYQYAKGAVYDKTCKHIDRVFKEGCFWHPQWHDPGPRTIAPVETYSPNEVPGEKCPGCGGPVVAIRVAV